jgi:hypothetical protein
MTTILSFGFFLKAGKLGLMESLVLRRQLTHPPNKSHQDLWNEE